MLTPHEFRHAIKNGTITNYETYLTFPNEKYRIIMAEEGVAIDELVSLGSSYLITLLVENNHAQEYWHDWAIHEASTVKEALINKEYNLDQFVHDDSTGVKYTLMNKAPQYIPQVAKQSKDDYANAFRILIDKNDVSTENLKTIVNLYDEYKTTSTPEDTYKAFCLKLIGQEQKANLMEKTMKPRELFLLDNPLWTRGYSIDVIDTLQKRYQNAISIKKEKLFEKHFDEMLNHGTTRTTINVLYKRLIENA